jgi:hypothetical protein
MARRYRCGRWSAQVARQASCRRETPRTTPNARTPRCPWHHSCGTQGCLGSTPPPHAAPGSVDRVSPHPVRAPETARYLSNKTTAASAGAANQIVSADLPLVAAITLRTNVTNLLPSGCFPKHCPTSKPRAGHTCLCGNPAQGQDSLSHRLRLPFSARWLGAVPLFTRQPEPSRPPAPLYPQTGLRGERNSQQLSAVLSSRPLRSSR